MVCPGSRRRGRNGDAWLLLQVAINTTIPDVTEFLNHIVASTNMKCLTPPSALSGKTTLTHCIMNESCSMHELPGSIENTVGWLQ